MRVPTFCLVLLLALSGCGVPYMRDTKGELPMTDYGPALLEQVRERVKTVLKSPASAQFSNEKVSANKDKHQIIVTGTVDSQNSFGAMLRGSYECVFLQREDGTQTSRGLFYDRDGSIRAAF